MPHIQCENDFFSHKYIKSFFPSYKKKLFITTNDFAVLHFTHSLFRFPPFIAKYTQQQQQSRKSFSCFSTRKVQKFSSQFIFLLPFRLSAHSSPSISLLYYHCHYVYCESVPERKTKELFNARSIDATFHISFSNVASSFSMSEMKT